MATKPMLLGSTAPYAPPADDGAAAPEAPELAAAKPPTYDAPETEPSSPQQKKGRPQPRAPPSLTPIRSASSAGATA